MAELQPAFLSCGTLKPNKLHTIFNPQTCNIRRVHHNTTLYNRKTLTMGAYTSTDIQTPNTNNSLQKKIMCHGELLQDLLSRTPDADITDMQAWKPFMGGCPANVAAVLCALQTPVVLSAPVGDDEAGLWLKQGMLSRGMDISCIQTMVGRKTRAVFVRKYQNGERKFIGMNGASTEEFADAMSLRINADLFNVHNIDTFVSGTMGLAFKGSAKTLREYISYAMNNNNNHGNVNIILDVNWRDQMWKNWNDHDARNEIIDILSYANIVKASIEDLQFLYGQDIAHEAIQNPEMIRQILKVQGVLVTAGENGAAASFQLLDKRIITARVGAFIPKSGVVNTVGAGDAFLAGFLTEFVKLDGKQRIENTEQLKQVLKFAARVAAVIVSVEGANEGLEGRSQVETFSGAFSVV